MPGEIGVLVVEDQPAVAQALAVLFDVHEIPCTVARSPEEALDAVRRGGVGVVVQDMNFSPSATSGREGIELFRSLRRLDPELPILLMTAWTSLETAVGLVKEGATDYFAKPWDDARLLATVESLLSARRGGPAGARSLEGGAAGEAAPDLRGLVVESPALKRVVALALRVAAADVPVLVTGPNGAGKEKVAEIVHANSRRAGAPFVKVNAGALPDDLLESELFGAEAGAFTGAARRRVGRFEAADGGTLFLDEIGNLSAAGQAKLLRVLQSGEFERLGSSETRRVDVRLLCATNADLPKAIADGRFREDLFFRLNVIELHVPPLRERLEDVLPLARHFLEAAGRGGARRTLSAEAEQALLRHAWPGNVRELSNRLQRAALVATSESLSVADLGLEAMPAPAGAAGPSPAREGAPHAADAERERLEALLLRHGGNVVKAAEELGVSRQALYRKMEKHGVVLERRPRA